MPYSAAFIISYVESAFLALRPDALVWWGIAYFLSIYLIFSSIAWCIAHIVNRPIGKRPIKSEQVRSELLDSIRSILIFSIALVVPWAMLKLGIAAFPTSISIVSILTEMLILIIWNDIYLYAIYRLLPNQFKKSHTTHHSSVTTTPFTAYNMSVWEAILLGSVMPIAMLFYDFSLVSLAFLPIWSIAINTLARTNFNLISNASKHSLSGLIKSLKR